MQEVREPLKGSRSQRTDACGESRSWREHALARAERRDSGGDRRSSRQARRPRNLFTFEGLHSPAWLACGRAENRNRGLGEVQKEASNVANAVETAHAQSGHELTQAAVTPAPLSLCPRNSVQRRCSDPTAPREPDCTMSMPSDRATAASEVVTARSRRATRERQCARSPGPGSSRRSTRGATVAGSPPRLAIRTSAGSAGTP